MLNNILEILTLLTIGWVSGVEMGDWFGREPTIARLGYEHQVHLQKSMAKTYGRVMPVIIPLSIIFLLAQIIFSAPVPGIDFWLRIFSVLCIITAILTTIIVNIPINTLTAKWQISNTFETWKQMRSRWRFYQGVRGWLFLLSFILLSIASVLF